MAHQQYPKLFAGREVGLMLVVFLFHLGYTSGQFCVLSNILCSLLFLHWSASLCYAVQGMFHSCLDICPFFSLLP